MRIKVKEEVLGTHSWSTCPIDAVGFLKNEHHHNFQIHVECKVLHDNRELEFLTLRTHLKKIIAYCFPVRDGIVRFGDRSCEQISNEITKHLVQHYGERDWKVHVYEDNVQAGGKW